MKTASAIMTRDVLTLAPELTLEEALGALSRRGVSAAPVCDRDRKLLGVLSCTDIAEAAFRDCGRDDNVAVAMNRHAMLTREDEAVEVLARRMVFEGAHRAIVVDGGGRVVGVVSALDVVSSLCAPSPGASLSEAHKHARFPSWPTRS